MKRIHASIIQSAYYAISGVWPIVHIKSFMEVTGPKADIWLVKMVGLLTFAVAVSIFIIVKRDLTSAKVLGISAAIAYFLIDVYYSGKGTISGIYLVDAGVELVIIILLLTTRTRVEMLAGKDQQ